MRPPIIDEEVPTAMATQPVMRQQPQGGAWEDPNRGRVQFDKSGGVARTGAGAIDDNDPDQPPYTKPMPKGSMTGKPYPTEEEFGSGDEYYSQIYRWEKDNGAFGLEYNSPEYKQFLQDYARKLNGVARPPAPKSQGMFGRPPGGFTANRMMIDE
jgi:hypothetical protein